MPYTQLSYDKKEHMVYITLKPPQINLQLAQELADACQQANQDDDTYVVVITGTGNFFCIESESGRSIEAEPDVTSREASGFVSHIYPIAGAVADIEKLPEISTLDRAIDRAREAHPRVRAAVARERALAADVGVERRSRAPDLSVDLFTDHELDRVAYGAGVEVELPLWSWNRGGIKRAEEMAAAGRREREGVVLDMAEQAISAHAACRLGVALARRYEERILPPAEAAAKTIDRTYELGEAPLIEVIDAHRTLLEIKREHLEALARAHADCSRLRMTIGEESP